MTQAAQLAQYGANNVGLSFKNRIINGDMTIAQRGTGTFTANGAFPVDRFQVSHTTDGAYSAQQDTTAPVGFTNSVKITTTTADSSLTTTQQLAFRHIIEGFNVADLGWGTANAQTVTLSFWVRSSLTGTFGGSLQNSDSNRSYVFTYTISAANTWEQKSVTIPGDTTGTWLTNNGRGIVIWFGLGVGPSASGAAGSWSASELNSVTGAVSVIGTLNATWYITGVQLEKGSVATSFDYLPYTTELLLCQRYFQQVDYLSSNGGISANWYYWNIGFLTQMRAAPILAAATSYNLNVGNASVLQGGVTIPGWVLEGSSPTGVAVRGSNTNLSQSITGRGWFSSEL